MTISASELPRQLPRLRHARPKRLDAEGSCRGDGLGTERRVRVGEVFTERHCGAHRILRRAVDRCPLCLERDVDSTWSARECNVPGADGRGGVVPSAGCKGCCGSATTRQDDLLVPLT